MYSSSETKTNRSRRSKDHEREKKKRALSPDDGGGETIAAVITPPGEGGVAAVRLAGPHSRKILDKFFKPQTDTENRPFLLRLGHFVSADGETLDEVMAVFMPHGNSYTGLEQVEIFCHGGRRIVQLILDELIAGGARAAQPGEFTKLAFLNGRIDLAKAEAVAEIIASNTDCSLKASREHLLGAYAGHIENMRKQLVAVLADLEASIDFSEEEIDPGTNVQQANLLFGVERQIREMIDSYTGGRIINEGFKIAIGGRPNAGKSSLFNLLLKQERALVNPEAGTTRDYLSEWIDIEGFAVNLIDTAGLRTGGGELEKEGQVRAEEIIKKADLILWMFDLSEKSWETSLTHDVKRFVGHFILLVGNKIDIAANVSGTGCVLDTDVVEISCLTRKGLKNLRQQMLSRIQKQMPDLTSGLVVTSARHKQKLVAARKAIGRARRKMKSNESPEIIVFELRRGIEALDEITGRVYNEEILGKIFSSFCIGK